MLDIFSDDIHATAELTGLPFAHWLDKDYQEITK